MLDQVVLMIYSNYTLRSVVTESVIMRTVMGQV